MDLTDIFELASNSDVGRRRDHNEDSSAIDAGLGQLAIADGMGGYRAGEVASAIAIATMVKHIRQRLPLLQPQQIDPDSGFSMESILARNAIREANYEVFRSAGEYTQFEGMGTTAVLMLFYDNHFTVAHVGDSRLYRFRSGQLEKITSDHSLIQELVDRGLYTQEQAEEKTPKNLVTRALGINETVSVDISEDTVLPKDLFLLCTDGLSDMVDDTEIHLTLEKFSDNLNRVAQELIDLANLRGGRDNISVVLARPTTTFPATSGWFDKLFGTT